MADGTFHELRGRLGEWFLRKQVLQAARAELPRPDEQAGRAYEQVRLLGEIARQVAEPHEELPPGRRPAVLLSLYRDFVYWALVAERKGDASIALDLGAMWQRTPGDRLLRAAGSAGNLEAVRGLLVDQSPTTSLDTTDEDVARVRAFAEGLYQHLDAPRQRVGRILIQRWLRLAAVGVVFLAIGFGIRAIVLGPNLATRQPFRTSSTLPECATSDGCSDVMFHTREENNPWVEFDLGGTKSIRRIEVRNRSQCCPERAIPLIVEVSDDRQNWKEVARRDTEFSRWKARIKPTPAAYVRLRVPRPTYLHLVDVVIR